MEIGIRGASGQLERLFSSPQKGGMATMTGRKRSLKPMTASIAF